MTYKDILLKLISDKPGITQREITSFFGTSTESYIRKVIYQLEDLGFIRVKMDKRRKCFYIDKRKLKTSR